MVSFSIPQNSVVRSLGCACAGKGYWENHRAGWIYHFPA